jgi:signal transduction histidine kinase
VKDLDEMELMVTQTLDYMRDAGRGEPVQPIDVDAVLESVQKDCEETGGEVAVRGAATAPYTGRPLALRRCVTNVVDNAVRYGGRATIVVEDAPGLLTLRIQDEGPGIPDAQLERAFEPFFRVEDSRSRDTGGTGLGLGIARNIARAHGGDVMLRNRPQGGLEAVVTLPRDARVESGAAAARPVRTTGAEPSAAPSLRDVPRDKAR